MPTLIKEEPGSPALLSGADQEELTMPQLEPHPFTEDVASGADEPAIKTEGVLLGGSVSSPPMTEEDSSPPLLAPVPADVADPVAESVPEATTGRQRRQSRRCVRQREEPIVKTESDSSSQGKRQVDQVDGTASYHVTLVRRSPVSVEDEAPVVNARPRQEKLPVLRQRQRKQRRKADQK